MEKLFEALRERHPGCAVIDVAFTCDRSFVGLIEPISILDEKLAIAIREAVAVDIATLF